MATIPPMNLGPDAAPWGREIQTRLQNQEQEIARLRQDVENSLRAINGSLSNIGGVVNVLNATAAIQYQEFNTSISGFSGWYSGPLPSVTVSSPTGRLEIGYGGALDGGDGYFCYSVVGAISGTIVSRDTILNTPAQRVAVTGGASFAPSGWHTGIISVPANETLTVTLQINSSSTFVTVFGGSIYARTSP